MQYIVLGISRNIFLLPQICMCVPSIWALCASWLSSTWSRVKFKTELRIVLCEFETWYLREQQVLGHLETKFLGSVLGTSSLNRGAGINLLLLLLVFPASSRQVHKISHSCFISSLFIIKACALIRCKYKVSLWQKNIKKI
jgi:hypothetical protein